MKRIRFISLVFIAGLFLSSCTNGDTPKPRGYFRIDFPERDYRIFDTTYPYTFEYPVYARILPDDSKLSEPFWINIHYPQFHAQLHLSFKHVNHNLAQYLEDSRNLVNKHIPKANAITQREYTDPERRVYGLVYDIRGPDAASVYQFYLTDSLSSFIRGALYFDLVPNNDSLAPVIDFLKYDIAHMINTFKWKQIPHQSSPIHDRNH